MRGKSDEQGRMCRVCGGRKLESTLTSARCRFGRLFPPQDVFARRLSFSSSIVAFEDPALLGKLFLGDKYWVSGKCAKRW